MYGKAIKRLRGDEVTVRQQQGYVAMRAHQCQSCDEAVLNKKLWWEAPVPDESSKRQVLLDFLFSKLPRISR